jgi:hypothetical protein
MGMYICMQGCQIFLNTIYQNEVKRTKLPLYYQMSIKYNTWPYYIPNGYKIYQNFPFQDPPKFISIVLQFCFRLLYAEVNEHNLNHGCQMIYFQTKNTNLGKFWRALHWKILVNFMAIWYILVPFGIFYGYLIHFVLSLVHFAPFWYVVPRKIWQPWSE